MINDQRSMIKPRSNAADTEKNSISVSAALLRFRMVTQAKAGGEDHTIFPACYEGLVPSVVDGGCSLTKLQ